MEPMPQDWERAVAVVAHPDDLEYGMASAVAHFTRAGKEVSYVLATRGEAGIDSMTPETCGVLREQEQRASAAVVGVSSVTFLDHPDGSVEYGIGLRRDIAGALRSLRPDVVFTINFELTWGDGGAVNHADHRAVGLATLDACRDAANRWIPLGSGEPWSGIKAIYVSGGGAPATHFVDVTDTIDLGVASLAEHRAYSEGLGTGFDPDQFLRDMAGFAGAAAGCEYAVLLSKFTV
jgi:LmbE family N-acetylglucosaminyl deacetylase